LTAVSREAIMHFYTSTVILYSGVFNRFSSAELDSVVIVDLRVVENGVETVTVEENGQLTSRKINGVEQAIEYK
jgi:hypothetical protein